MILEEVAQSVLAIVATAIILTLFVRMVAVALKAVADGDRKKLRNGGKRNADSGGD